MKIRRMRTALGLEKRQILLKEKWYDIPENNEKARDYIENLRMTIDAPVMAKFLKEL